MGTLAPFLGLLEANANNESPKPPTVYPMGSLILVGVVLVVLGFLFWLMVIYANRIAQTAPLGEHVRDVFCTQKQEQILKSQSEKWDRREFHRDIVHERDWLQKNPVPDVPQGLEGDYTTETARSQFLDRGWVGTLLPGGLGGSSPATREEVARETQRTDYLGGLRRLERTVDQEARRRYWERQQASGDEAKAATGSSVFRTFDFASLWGQGPEFVLQFTAVVTIIFAVIALGILNQIGREQAGTILAAIAGYVLGHATGRGTRSGNLPSGSPQGTQKVEPSEGGGGPPLSESIPERGTSSAALPKMK